MLSIGTLSAGQGFYYTDLAREQYYMDGGEPPGMWFGDGAQSLGLSGEVTKEALHEVLKGFGKGGAKLVQNAGTERRQAGLDLTFSADKSVSVLWALGDDATRRFVEEAHTKAVESALHYLQEEAAWVRLGQGGEVFERCRFVMATFLHGTSRASDPNLHTHALIANVGVGADGTTRAIWNKELYEHKMAAGALYRVTLATALRRRGFAIDTDGTHGLFRVRGIAEALCEHFSKRRAQIELELQERGYSSAKAADHANRATRNVKGHEARTELVERWRAEAERFGVQGFQLPEAPRAIERGPSLFETAQKHASDLARKQAVFRPQDLIRSLAGVCQGGLYVADDLMQTVQTVLQSPELVWLNREQCQALYTTREQLHSEQHLFALGERLANTPGEETIPDSALRFQEDPNLDAPERRAAFDYLTLAPGNLKLLAGLAGTGKTSLLRVAREAWEAAGYRVLGMAVSGKAARELEHGAGIASETVRMRQIQLGTEVAAEYFAELGKSEPLPAPRSKRGDGGTTFPKLTLDSKTVLVIDEASMLGLRDTTELLEFAGQAGAKVIFVGDERQLQAIDAVSPFDALGERFGRVQLRTIQRQRNAWMRSAVQAFAQGDVRTGLSLLQANESLHIGKGGPEATRSALVSSWMELPAEAKSKLILTATNEEAQRMNGLIQEARHKARELGAFLTVKLGSGEHARRGDRVLFRKNNRKLNVRNGELGTIVKIHRPIDANPFSKGHVTVALDGGGAVRLNLNQYEHLSLGYALTTHKAQGTTVEHAWIYTTPRNATRDLLYVQASRARESMSIYCPGHDLGEDLAQFQRALDHTRPSPLLVSQELRREGLSVDHCLDADEKRRRMGWRR